MQLVQLLSTKEKYPGLHALQVVPFLKYPAAQTEQSWELDTPTLGVHLPDGQAKQEFIPALSVYSPKPQNVHVSSAFEGPFVPEGHKEQVVEPVPEAYVPMVHATGDVAFVELL
jgi:hypothetical protein